MVKDTRIGLVRVILLVEDSIRYYSRYLPLLYTEIMKQTQRIISDEHLVDMKKLLRMRARPKVLMAESYEEAQGIIEEYKDYLLCLITDMRFPVQGKRDEEAGAKLIQFVRRQVPDLAILLQSAEAQAAERARELNASHIHGVAVLPQGSQALLVSGQYAFVVVRGRSVTAQGCLDR